MSEYVLEMRNIWKVYPNGVTANKGVNLRVKKGEIHALLGENGAGKSTLMKILFGFEKPTEGEIYYNGELVHINSPDKAIELKIGMVHQHFMLVPSLTVVENVVLGMEPRKGFSIDLKKSIEFVKNEMNKYGLPVPLMEKVKDISVGMKQRVEIIKTLVRGADLIILDEPTAVLTPQETVELFKALKNLTKAGKTVIFITHKLNEVKEIADRITVLRRGRTIGEAEVKDITEKDMSRMMVGRDVDISIEKTPSKPGRIVLEAKNIEYTRFDGVKMLKGINLKLREGEILGIAGVEGNGQTELVDIITGMDKPEEGEIFIFEKSMMNANNPHEFRKVGMSFIPADRMIYGVSKEDTIEENLISDRFEKEPFSKKGVLRYNKITEFARKMIDEFDIRTDGPKTAVKMLSGGNIQKVVVAREFTSNSKIIVADQPTRGIDIAAADFIRRRLVKERDNNVAVLLISSDLTELLEVSDRILVIYHGEFVAHFEDISQINENILGEYMLGIKKMSKEEMGDLI
ncbi:heme ABC transporter ATP-binding protein [Marinitoga sp. 1197]|uniref:ABC transporter ATP-binding protein n=1 Tax=Marinitoga sp. 1197 TaxID=1428449 RepID=UPI00064129DD|nr:ABC transporter ATP-binding protein [Marinitoga sp. 1197]KLO22283.1 heme ABC transporter ATP-binding protein [Marinitoga sp. 1197]